MLEANNAARLLNPWVFHLQKLQLELKCLICLNLLNKPVLLPCNHIFCSACVSQFGTQCAAPDCQTKFNDQEVRPAPYMENIVKIYKSLESANCTILPQLSTDFGSLSPLSTSSTQPRTKHGEGTVVSLNNHTNAFPEGPEPSPGSSVSRVGDKRDPASRNRSTETNVVTKPVRDISDIPTVEVVGKDTYDKRVNKRLKKLNGPPEVVLESHGDGEQRVSLSDQAAVSSCHHKCKLKEKTSTISFMAPPNESSVDGRVCAFCQTAVITEESGTMLHFVDGKEVEKGEPACSCAITVHSRCVQWTPRVFFDQELQVIKNLESEIARAFKLKCTSCGVRGAALGCYIGSCRSTYHVPCAIKILHCRWDMDNYLLLCPAHKSYKFPSEKDNSYKLQNTQFKFDETKGSTFDSRCKKWVFCGSGLSAEETCLLVEFAGTYGATVFKSWRPDVTHVIVTTDSNGACTRSLNVLLAILNGKWTVRMDWIRACKYAKRPINEEPYEVNLDNHGFQGGPKAGRLRASKNSPKLFSDLSFCIVGDFVPTLKNDLLDIVRAGGGTIIESLEKCKEQRNDQQVSSTTLVVYNEHSCDAAKVVEIVRRVEDEVKDGNTLVIPHTWIMDSAAVCKLLPYPLC